MLFGGAVPIVVVTDTQCYCLFGLYYINQLLHCYSLD